ncbi:MAG TPA: M14 family zinc carboxypeptidase [Polyangia bacterium]|nr:M14 family zinc carboxypeptidase [Polyangia bacterium]
MANYHVWHHPSLDGKPAFATTALTVPTIDPTAAPPSEVKLFQSLRNDMDQLRADGANKGIVDPNLREVGVSGEGLELWALKLGKGSACKVLFTGCHHAREWISVEVPFLVAKFLIDHYTDTPSTDAEKRVKHLIDNREIWFVPLVNPDGHEFSVLSDRLWRPNRNAYFLQEQDLDAPQFGGGVRRIHVAEGLYRGVDLNRNYPTATWGQETWRGRFPTTSRDPADAKHGIWAGPSAASEVETQQIVSLMAAQSFRASITYHSFSQLLLYPAAAEKDAFVQFVGKGMSSLIDANGNPYTYESGSALYPTTGDLMEFSYQAESGRPTFTPEVRPTEAGPESSFFSGLPEAEIEPTFQENLGAALALINCAGFDAPAASVKVTWAPGASVAQVVRNGWKAFQGFSP